MKRFGIPVLLAIVVAGSLFLAGCKKEEEAKVINFWYWDQNGDKAYAQLISEFETQNPGIKVVSSVVPWADYWTKLQTALPTGTGPDVFWLNHPNAVTYLPTGLVMDLEPAAAEIKFENFNQNFYTPYTYQSKRYGVPIFYDVTVLYYNKAHFDKAGISYPDGNWKWADLLNAAQKLTIREGGKVTQYGIAVEAGAQSGFPGFVLQNGGKIFSDDRMKCIINNSEAREALQFQMDLIHKYKVAPTIQELQETSKTTIFQSGMASMAIHHTGILKQFAEAMGQNLQIAPVPMEKQRAAIFHNLAYVGSAKTKNPDAVKKFLAFLATKHHAEVLSTVWTPCYNGTTDLFYGKFNWINSRVISESIEYGYPLPIAARNAGAIYTLLSTEMDKVFMQAQLGNLMENYEKVINDAIAK